MTEDDKSVFRSILDHISGIRFLQPLSDLYTFIRQRLKRASLALISRLIYICNIIFLVALCKKLVHIFLVIHSVCIVQSSAGRADGAAGAGNI